jgi:hypothetical protein
MQTELITKNVFNYFSSLTKTMTNEEKEKLAEITLDAIFKQEAKVEMMPVLSLKEIAEQQRKKQIEQKEKGKYPEISKEKNDSSYEDIVWTKNRIRGREKYEGNEIKIRTPKTQTILGNELVMGEKLINFIGNPIKCSICFKKDGSLIIYPDEENGMLVQNRNNKNKAKVININKEAGEIILKNKNKYQLNQTITAIKKESNNILPRHIVIETIK